MYCVIVGDIIRSKELYSERREDDTSALECILERINAKYKDNIMASFGIVRGDAFEGVLYSQQYVPSIIQEIIKYLYEERKLKVRISAVMDELSSVSSERNKADGPAFHIAIQEIDRLKKNNSNHWFQVSIKTNTVAQPLVEGLISLLSALTKHWTEKQREIVWNMADFSEQQSLVSKKLNISTTVVNKQLKAADYEAYINAWNCLKKYLVEAEEESTKYSNNHISYTTYYSIGRRKNKLRDYSSAIDYFTKSIKLAEDEFGENDIRLVPIYNGLAESYLEQLSDNNIENQKILAKAKNTIDLSLLCQEGSSKIRLDYALTINILGNYFLESTNVNRALESFYEAKKIIQDLYGSHHPLLHILDNNIAIAYKRNKDYKNALEYYKRSLNKAKEDAAYDPLGYADSLYNIGLCYEEMEKFEDALKKFEESLEIYLSVLPQKHEYIIENRETIERIKGFISKK